MPPSTASHSSRRKHNANPGNLHSCDRSDDQACFDERVSGDHSSAQFPSAVETSDGKDPGYFVDPNKGEDKGPGSLQRPWATINHALKQLNSGDTLYLRGGRYFENVYCANGDPS